MGYKEVVEALGSTDRMQRCPVHDDRTASLSVKEGDDGKALIYCHAGCTTLDVCEALGLKLSDLMEMSEGHALNDVYVYTDEQGSPLVRVLRGEGKKFFQQRWEDGEWQFRLKDTRRTLYNLPAICAAAPGTTCYVVEGEKDAETLLGNGYLATTSIGGANKWRDDYNDSLRHLDVVLVGDNDDAGRESIEKIGQSLTASGIEYRVAFPTEGYKDVTEIAMNGEPILQWLSFKDADTSIFEPFDWENYETGDIEWLMEPYVPVASRVLAFGPAGSLKSLWAIWLAAKLTQEGKKVAYFNLEMQPTDLTRRLKQAHPVASNLMVFTRFSMNRALDVTTAIRALQGVSLIIVDSWTAAHKGADNDEVARLDNEVFKPLIASTGATLLILDNTGHPSTDIQGRKVQTGYARGASAKGDKMEVTLWFDRPDDGDNYKTKLTVKKMRLDHPMPKPVTIETPRDKIEFYYADKTLPLYTRPLWPQQEVLMESTSDRDPEGSGSTPGLLTVRPEDMTSKERRAYARMVDKLGATKINGLAEGVPS